MTGFGIGTAGCFRLADRWSCRGNVHGGGAVHILEPILKIVSSIYITFLYSAKWHLARTSVLYSDFGCCIEGKEVYILEGSDGKSRYVCPLGIP